MASTITIDAQPLGRRVSGSKKVRQGVGNLGAYATGGVAVTKAQLEFAISVDDFAIRPTGGYVFEWIKSSGLVKAYDQKDPAAAGGADIALPEVGNAVSLAAVSFRFRAEGI